ncbi:hypothetical protein EUX98_g680 [Antrodiella citrinella]|uniref:RRM domain-containing protein n=1 Tax=Antrodiella citrinella TaxID=2447956 RepID=A0A4V3XJL1_9APHY|nr:hypothetical protein EUX98_g680 [Antrodiella citrinella]
MGEPTKLTKKQKKGQAFRERKGKGRAKPGDDFDEDNAVPVAEDQDRAAIPAVESPEVDEPKEDGPPAVVQKPKGEKRKREDGAEEAGVKTKKKRGDEAVEEVKKVSKEGMKQRFILFIGNLKYTTSAEAVRNHFKECVPPPTVRLRTPKPSETSRPTAKSKGFAFLEFDNKGALQTALKLHHSQLEGRNINVELTAGGGGKSETRLAKVKTRNKELHEQRVKKLQKQQPRNSASKEEAESDLQPQRYSTTSGFDQTPKVKRTWTIGSTLEENTKQKKRGNKKPPRSHGTGVNAIPVS